MTFEIKSHKLSWVTIEGEVFETILHQTHNKDLLDHNYDSCYLLLTAYWAEKISSKYVHIWSGDWPYS